MEIIPAVDIMKGRVVRLIRGDPELLTSYEHLGDPVTVARRWESEMAKIIHIIDLDAALGLGNNLDVIGDILMAVDVPVQVGGGIRSLNIAQTLLEMGVNRIILGSLAFEESSTVKMLLEGFGESRTVVALDHLDDRVMIQGWKTSTKVTVDEAVSKFLKLGVKLFLVTSVARDGTMRGPDLETLIKIRRPNIDVIAAGGIRSLEDLIELKHIGVSGVVIGKALYEGMFTLKEALQVVGGV